MITLIANLFRKIGLDQSVAWTLTTQGSRFITGTVSMILIVRFLSTEAQGYAYTFGSILAISVFLEMGFSQNILQFAAHEFSKLRFDDSRRLAGDACAFSRFTSLGRLSFKYYAIASVAFFFAAVFGGLWFFAYHSSVDFIWRAPWVIACVSSALALLLNPCWSLLQGCNQIAEIERFRFVNSLLGFVAMSCGLMMGGGLFAVVAPSVVNIIASVLYLSWRWKHFFLIFMERPENGQISWVREIWPFQWRIAISWISGYFIFSAITPVVFRVSGAGAAGRVGFTLQLLRTVCGLAASWSTTKLPLFGILVARGEWAELASVWRKATLMTVAVSAVGCVVAIVAMNVIAIVAPSFSTRYSGTQIALLFGISLVLQNLISGYAYYLRAFKKEPFVLLSIFQAVLSFGMVVGLTVWLNEFGAALGYMAATLATALPAWIIFRTKRTLYQDASIRELGPAGA